MKTISQINSYCKLFLGEQKLVDDKKYRILTYCRLVPFNGIFLLFNNLTKELLELTVEEGEILKQKEFTLCEKTEYLIKNWFLVPVDNNDMLLKNQIENMVKLTNHKNYMDVFVIFTTTDCNARCFYCFEHGAKKIHMTKEIAEQTAKYIIEKSKGQKVSISWFGGEPLYNMSAIDIIVKKLKEANIEFSSKITTNAYLFDQEIIEKAKNHWNLKLAQITLDGTENIYNRCKNYIYTDDISPYQKVLDNIENLIKSEIFVRVRVNLGVHNYEDIYSLVTELENRFCNTKFLKINIATIYEKADNLASDEKYAELMSNLFKLEDYIYQKGLLSLRKLSTKIQTNYCFADTDTGIVITPSGKLTKCEHCLEKDFVGDIYSEEINKELWDSWKERVPIVDLCHTCAYYPTCLTIKKCDPSTSRICNLLEQQRCLRILDRQIIEFYNKKRK